MSASSFHAGMSPLDEAYAKWLAGDGDGALRHALAVLAAAEQQLGAATLIARLLAEADRPVVVGEAAARLVDGYVRRGDLAQAVVASRVADGAGEDGKPLRKTVAEAFGKGSKRLADVSPAPPPLPAKDDVAPILARLEGAALYDRAEDALQKLLSSEDPMPEDAKVPELPLFSALEPAALQTLLEGIDIKDIAQDDRVIEQGAPGTEAYVVARGVLEVKRAAGGEEVTLAALGPGSIFGEMALVSDTPRAASVVAVEPCTLLVAPREDLETLAEKEPAIGKELGTFCRQRMVANLMRHSAILRAVDASEREDLIDRFQTRTFKQGDAIVEKDDETEGLFLIASGGVEVSGEDADGDRLRIAELGPGDVVGEISLVLRRPATADVRALHPTVALELTREAFQEAIREHPGLLNELYETATKREEETRSVVAQEALDVEDVVIV